MLNFIHTRLLPEPIPYYPTNRKPEICLSIRIRTASIARIILSLPNKCTFIGDILVGTGRPLHARNLPENFRSRGFKKLRHFVDQRLGNVLPAQDGKHMLGSRIELIVG